MPSAKGITGRVLSGLGIATVHFLISTNALVLVLGDTSGPRPEWMRIVAPVAAVVGLVLGLPAIAIPPAWIPDGMPGGFFGVMSANSLLWGFALVTLWSLRRHGRR